MKENSNWAKCQFMFWSSLHSYHYGTDISWFWYRIYHVSVWELCAYIIKIWCWKNSNNCIHILIHKNIHQNKPMFLLVQWHALLGGGCLLQTGKWWLGKPLIHLFMFLYSAGWQHIWQKYSLLPRFTSPTNLESHII